MPQVIAEIRMRVPPTPLLIALILCLLCDWYIFRCIRSGKSGGFGSKVYIAFSTLCYCVLGVALMLPRRDGDNAMLLTVMWMLFSFATVYLSKVIYVVIDLIGRIPQLFRCKRMSYSRIIAGVMSVIVFLLMWWGALVNRFSIDTVRLDFSDPSLPQSFDGYKIVQISDLHVGTFGDNTAFLSRLVDSINVLKPDLVVFTGDIVNTRSDELLPHVNTLSQLKAPDGVISILGNHDYGDYANWPSMSDKDRNLEDLKMMQRNMGWRLLCNETAYIKRGGDSIAIIGVENIGDPPFHIYGSLDKAYSSLNDTLFKVLLSHNPAHWRDSIRSNDQINIPLTLSGHTHAMQMELAGVSPAALRYKEWGGLYFDPDSTHSLYVNIGAGTVGFPARIGAKPEITLIKLRKRL